MSQNIQENAIAPSNDVDVELLKTKLDCKSPCWFFVVVVAALGFSTLGAYSDYIRPISSLDFKPVDGVCNVTNVLSWTGDYTVRNSYHAVYEVESLAFPNDSKGYAFVHSDAEQSWLGYNQRKCTNYEDLPPGDANMQYPYSSYCGLPPAWTSNPVAKDKTPATTYQIGTLFQGPQHCSILCPTKSRFNREQSWISCQVLLGKRIVPYVDWQGFNTLAYFALSFAIVFIWQILSLFESTQPMAVGMTAVVMIGTILLSILGPGMSGLQWTVFVDILAWITWYWAFAFDKAALRDINSRYIECSSPITVLETVWIVIGISQFIVSFFVDPNYIFIWRSVVYLWGFSVGWSSTQRKRDMLLRHYIHSLVLRTFSTCRSWCNKLPLPSSNYILREYSYPAPNPQVAELHTMIEHQQNKSNC